jgi:hypothetical protein
MYMPRQERDIQATRPIRRSRIYRGEEETELLVWWLNNCKDKAAQERVRTLLDSLTRMISLVTEMPASARNQSGREWVSNAKTRSFEEHESYINRLLERYRAVPSLSVFKRRIGGDEVVDLDFNWMPTGKSASVPIAMTDFLAIARILDLETESLLRVRLCDCGKAFFGRFAHQKFCSDTCRIEFYTYDPKWKTYRAKKAREYYSLHQTKNIK